MSGSTTTATQVSAAYTAILRVAPPGGDTGAFSTSVAAQINQGLLSLGNFESSLINLDQTTYTTLAALVTIDAFYNASPSSATLTTVATATSGTTFVTAAELHNLGYSDPNVWTILASNWGADPTSNFNTLYGGLATGATNDYTTFINAVYLREFGALPTAANLQNLLNDIPGVGQLLSGGGHTATPLQIMSGLYGFLLYTGQVNNIGQYAAKAPSFLSTAATDEATTPGSSAPLYGPEILANTAIPGGQPATQVFLTVGNDNVTSTAIFGSLTPFSINGIGPTLNAADIINGSPGTTTNTLTISDDFASGNDQIPLGTTINNIQTVILQTAGAAGGTGLFDTSAYPSVNNVIINSSGGFTDNVRVSPTTNLTVNHQDVAGPLGVAVATLGGANVNVVNQGPGAVLVGNTVNANANPTGAVQVSAVTGAVVVLGGTTVTVNEASIAPGGVTVGVAGFSVSPGEPTGAVTVNAPATSAVAAGTPITVFGGTSATLTSGGGAVTIGALIVQTVFTVQGPDTVVDNAAITLTSNYLTGANAVIVPVLAPPGAVAPFSEIAVAILGGTTVNVTTNAGGVSIGANAVTAYNGTVLIPGLEPTGNVTVSDTADLAPSTGTVIPTTVGGFIAAITPVNVFGGANVSVTDAGSIVNVGSFNGTNVVAPTGTVTVADTAQVVHDGIVNKDNSVITDIGGTAVTITTNAGDVMIGTSTAIAGTEPTGDINVIDTGTDSVTSFGGVNATVAATNGFILVGAAAGVAATNPTGNVTATETGLFTGNTGIIPGGTGITVAGGVTVTTSTTGGNTIVGTAKTPITGPVTVSDTQVGPSSDPITVVGGVAGATGPSVAITTTATSGAIQVGPTAAVFTGTAGNAALNTAGTGLKTPADYANGLVTVTSETVAGTGAAGATNVFGTGAINVATNGATAVTIIGGGSANVVDEQTTLATGGASAGSAIGTSTLTTVSLDGVGPGLSTLISGVLANLSVLDSAKGNPTNVAVVSPAAMTLTLGNDATDGTTAAAISDAKAASITVATPTGSTASSTFELSAGALTSLTFTNTAPVTLLAATLAPITSADGALKTITISGSGSVTLPDFTTGTTTDGALSAINGTGSSGAITVGGINVFQTSVTPGTGPDTVTIINNPNPPSGSTVQKITGATGSTIIANYVAGANDQSLHSVSQISGFTTMGLGPLTNSFVGPFAAKGFTASNPYDVGGFSNLTIGATAGSVVFSDVGAGTTNLAITAPQGGANTITYLLNDAVAEVDPLAITIGFPATSTKTTGITSTINLGIDTATSTKPSIGIVGNISITSVNPATDTAPNVVNLIDSIPGLSGLPASGTVAIAVGGTAPATVTYGLAGAVTQSSVGTITDTDSATVDVTGVALSPGGTSFTGGSGLLKAFGSGELPGSGDNTKALDTFTTGTGGGVFTVGSGGGWNVTLTNIVNGKATTPAGSNDSGNETINLSASNLVSDTLNVGPAIVSINNGAGVGGITGFLPVASAKVADVIALTGTGAVGNGADGAPSVNGYSTLTNAAANNSSPAGVQNVYNFVSQSGGQIAKDLANLDPNSLLANLTFSSSNGVITFGAVDGSNINQFNPTQLLTAAEGIVTEEAFLTGQDQITVFSAAFAGLPANTYIVASDFYNTKVTPGSGTALTSNVGHIFGATEIELNGVTGITGFGPTAALASVELTGANGAVVGGALPGAFQPTGPAGPSVFLSLFNGGTGNLGTTAGTAFNDAGFSEDTLGGGAGKGGPAGANSTNTYNNLGSAAQIDITAPGAVGALVVGAQVGTQGSDSFVLNFNATSNAGLLNNGASTLAGLTVTSDDLVTILLNGSLDTITAFADPNTTVASLVASGAGSLTITNPISDAALVSIDAHNVTGVLSVSATESGLTINGAIGGDVINASGSGDTVTIGASLTGGATLGGPIEITANASGDTITLVHEGNGINALMAAASGGDTITVDAGNNSLAGTFNVAPAVPGSTFSTSLGTGDTISLHSATAAGAGFSATDLAWVGSGTTVNLGTSTTAFGSGAGVDSATVAVIGDATGATSGSSPAMTVITGFATAGANATLNVQFDNTVAAGHISFTTAPTVPTFVWAGGTATLAQVNEASATSLASALDIAASQTVNIDAFHSPAAHTTVTHGVTQLNATTALADWFQFGGNTYIVEAINSTSAAAAHAALGTGDVVVELTGLINVATNAHLHVI
jgi:hypothetical protein